MHNAHTPMHNKANHKSMKRADEYCASDELILILQTKSCNTAKPMGNEMRKDRNWNERIKLVKQCRATD